MRWKPGYEWDCRMMSELEIMIKIAEDFAVMDDFGGAMEIVEKLLSVHPDEVKVWMLRGYVHELQADFRSAKNDLSHAIQLSTAEPHLFYTRGRMCYSLRDFDMSIKDFTRALDLCDLHQNDYYRQELHFWRAEAFLKLGRRFEAMNDLENVDDGFQTWIDQIRSKEELVVACQ